MKAYAQPGVQPFRPDLPCHATLQAEEKHDSKNQAKDKRRDPETFKSRPNQYRWFRERAHENRPSQHQPWTDSALHLFAMSCWQMTRLVIR
jgi:hypothetical protein